MTDSHSPAERIREARDRDDVARVFAVMRELRAHHTDEAAFVEQVARQRSDGYRLAFLESGTVVRAAAGYRIYEQLFAGRVMYVDDLVTREADRSRGYGGRLFDWLLNEARREKCRSFTLDSGVHRFDAHRFYLTKRMKIAAHHFTLDL